MTIRSLCSELKYNYYQTTPTVEGRPHLNILSLANSPMIAKSALQNSRYDLPLHKHYLSPRIYCRKYLPTLIAVTNEQLRRYHCELTFKFMYIFTYISFVFWNTVMCVIFFMCQCSFVLLFSCSRMYVLFL